jgi:hypothetical protein
MLALHCRRDAAGCTRFETARNHVLDTGSAEVVFS